MQLNRTISVKEAQDFCEGTKKLEPHELKYKGKAAWDDAIAKAIIDINVEGPCGPDNLPCRTHNHTLAFFACPLCNKVEPNTLKIFQLTDIDKGCKCSHCSKQSALRYWKCSCDKRWHHCPEHRNTLKQPLKRDASTIINTPKGKTSNKPKAVKRRHTLRTSFKHLLEDDVQRTSNKRAADGLIPLGKCRHSTIKPNLVGPSLRSRFFSAM